ncbi:MAG: DnaJ domain-containing protein [Candidatus Nitrosopelagicus sp.]
MNYKYGVLCGILFLLFLPFNANAEYTDSVNMSVDLPIYTKSDVITIYGNVIDELRLLISITGPDGEIVQLHDNSMWEVQEISIWDSSFNYPMNFSHDVILSDYDLQKSGVYVISVEYNMKAEVGKAIQLSSEFFYDSGYNVNPMDVSNEHDTISESDQIFIFSISGIVIIGTVIFLARHSIIRKKTEYDTGEWDSKKNRDYEKYHSDWMSDEVNFERDGKKKLTDEEFRKSLLANNLPNYYEILQIQKNTSQAEIKNQYRHLAKKWHPDREKSPGAERKMMQINMAYEVLSNPKRRKMYDQHFSE